MSGLIGIRTRKSLARSGADTPTSTDMQPAQDGTAESGLSTTRSPTSSTTPSTTSLGAVPPARLGVLSVHFEAGRCRVQCPFCYLGEREGAVEPRGDRSHGGSPATTPIVASDEVVAVVAEALDRLAYRELAITLSEPVDPLAASDVLPRLLQAARRLGRLAAVTTTLAVATTASPELLAAATRLNLSIDPFKGPFAGRLLAPVGQVGARDVGDALAIVAQRFPQAERVLIATLSTPRFAEQLCDGLLAELLDLPTVDRVALNAVKPPPAWCDRAFWLRALQKLRPLLARELDRRLFLDCYVAARILGLGDCPARPDISPAPTMASPGAPLALAFRGCVYQPRADFLFQSADELAGRTANFVAPAVCPFPID